MTLTDLYLIAMYVCAIWHMAVALFTKDKHLEITSIGWACLTMLLIVSAKLN